MNKEERDMKLWAYIDGSLDAAERDMVTQNVATSPEWAAALEEITVVQEQLTNGLSLEVPSLRFAKNVMDMLDGTPVYKAARKYINPAVIRGVAAVFLVPMLLLSIWTLFSVNWGITSQPLLHLGPVVSMLKGISTQYVVVGLGINIFLALVLADRWREARKRRKEWGL